MTPIPTPDLLQKQARKLNELNRGEIAVLRKMHEGQTLHRGRGSWRMSDGCAVADRVAQRVIADHRVVGVGDTLFEGGPSETYRYADSARW